MHRGEEGRLDKDDVVVSHLIDVVVPWSELKK